ncbi:MAG: methyltransferase [Aquiluna sp.]|jgi:16S rRNA (guanine1207-N2)-methyltransferase
MASDHYFSAEPQAEAKSYPIEFEVAGQTIKALGASGTFSANKLDAGTRVLLNLHANFPSRGRVLDLGCGWGPISLALASQSPELEVLAVDVNQRSLAQTAENAASLGLTNVSTSLESDMSDGQIFDQIWSNPPIRVGKEVLHALMEKYLPMLAFGGSAWMVVQKQLGAESFQKWLTERFRGFEVERVANDKGYRVLRVTRLPKSQ